MKIMLNRRLWINLLLLVLIGCDAVQLNSAGEEQRSYYLEPFDSLFLDCSILPGKKTISPGLVNVCNSPDWGYSICFQLYECHLHNAEVLRLMRHKYRPVLEKYYEELGISREGWQEVTRQELAEIAWDGRESMGMRDSELNEVEWIRQRLQKWGVLDSARNKEASRERAREFINNTIEGNSLGDDE